MDGGKTWQLIGRPLYVPVHEAAKIAGVSQHAIREYVNDKLNPLPHIKSGSKVLVRVAALPEYLKSREAGQPYTAAAKRPTR